MVHVILSGKVSVCAARTTVAVNVDGADAVGAASASASGINSRVAMGAIVEAFGKTWRSSSTSTFPVTGRCQASGSNGFPGQALTNLDLDQASLGSRPAWERDGRRVWGGCRDQPRAFEPLIAC